jgi:hypothetical protein
MHLVVGSQVFCLNYFFYHQENSKTRNLVRSVDSTVPTLLLIF